MIVSGKAILFVTLFLFSKAVVVSREYSLSLEEAVAAALQHSPLLKEKQLSLSLSKLDAIASWNRFFPRVSLLGNFRRSNLSEKQRTQTVERLQPNLASSTPQGYTEVIPLSYDLVTPRWNAGLRLVLDWEWNASSPFYISACALSYQQSKLSLEGTREQLILEVKQAYYHVLWKEEMAALAKERAERMREKREESMKQPEQQWNFAYRNSMLTAKWNYLEEVYLQELRDLEEAQERLKFLLGVEQETALILTDSVAKGEMGKEMSSLSMRKSLGGRGWEYRIQELHHHRNFRVGQLTPGFFVRYLWDPTFRKDPFASPWFENPSEDWQERKGALLLGISLPLSAYFPFSGEMVWLMKLNKEIERTKLQQSEWEREREYRISSLYTQQAKTQEESGRLEGLLETALQSYEAVRLARFSGIATDTEEESTEELLYQVRCRHLEARYRYALQSVELEYLFCQ